MRITCRSIEPVSVDGAPYLTLHCSRNILREELKRLAEVGGTFLDNLEAHLKGKLKLPQAARYPEVPVVVSCPSRPVTLVADRIAIVHCSQGIDLIRLYLRDTGMDLSWIIGEDLALRPLTHQEDLGNDH